MRDEHRFREKIELSLENRQVAAIGIASLLFLGAAFSLGVLVGKRLASRAAVPAPLDDLAALDAGEAPGQGRKPPAAVRSEVTRPGTGAESPRAAETPRAPETPRRPEPATAPDLAKAHDPARESAAPLPTAQSGVVAPVPALRPAPVRSIAQPPAPASIAPGSRTAQVTAAQTAVLPAPPANIGKFTVQVGATQDRAEARELAGRVSKAGLRPYVVEAKLPARGLWYRVRVGSFADRAAADRFRKDVERELRSPAMVMPSG